MSESSTASTLSMDRLIVYGGGGHGKTLIELVQGAGMYTVAGVVDDGIAPGTEILGVPVLGGSASLPGLCAQGICLAVNGVGGINHVETRVKVFEILAEAGFRCPAVVHPSAFIEPSACLDDGVQVLARSYVSSAARIGFGTVINAGVVVSHDCILGKVVNLSPGAMLAGGVVIEDYAQVGMAATINLNITVGRYARIGNGATVKKDVPAGTVVHAGCIWPPHNG
jgi:acetyltransferase EpsM